MTLLVVVIDRIGALRAWDARNDVDWECFRKEGTPGGGAVEHRRRAGLGQSVSSMTTLSSLPSKGKGPSYSFDT